MSVPSYLISKKPYATEQLTVSTVALSPTAATVRNTTGTSGANTNYWAVSFPASAAIVECATNGVYYTTDGSTPSSTNGHRLHAGDVLTLSGRQSIAALKMIRQSADSVVNITFYKE
jgi:hypothetical protein